MQSLLDSIESLKTEDFSGQWKTDIYLDPEAQKIYTFLDTGGIPMSAYHRIDRRILTVSPSSIPSSVHRAVASVADKLEFLVSLYGGSEWNGNNHVGQWSEEAELLYDCIQEELASSEIASYWDAGDWFSPIIPTLRAEWKAGKTAEQIIDEQGCGDEIDGMCDRDEAIAWLQSEIDKWEHEEEEEED